MPGTLARELERALLGWVWKNPNGIGYLELPLAHPPPQKPGQCDRWLASLEILARGFPSWVARATGDPVVAATTRRAGILGFWRATEFA
jgi:hypothetical protein